MGELFLKILNMSIAASWLILAVALFRFVLKKTPKWINVFLWGIVALRLMVPFSFESAFSLVPSAETFNAHNIQYETPAITSGIPAVNHAVNPVLSETFAPNPGGSVNPLYTVTFILSVIWLIGIAAMLLYAVVSYVRVHRSVAERAPYEGNIFQCDHVKSPFILGLVRPKIYLPSGMDEAAIEPVIAHEKAHLARRDHWWKPLGFLVLTVHWFNPLCWIAYALLCRDIELACDEKVIRQMDLEEKKRYSTALLDCSTGRRMVTICPLAFGEVGVKERVKNVLNYKKPAFWVIVLAIAACVVVAMCFATNPATSETNTPNAERPTLVLDGVAYVDPYMPVSSLPYGYQSAGKLTREQANNTELEGIEYFVHPSGTEDFYTWQECGTPIDLNTVDSTKRQWAYVRWIKAENDSIESRKLTLDDVVMLSQKGDALTWSDFARYQGQDIGSGLYIMRYEIDEIFDVVVGGGSMDESPMYIRLRNQDIDAWVDLREDDVERVKAFIETYKNDAPFTVEALREKYPEYFDLDTVKGLEVYVWQMAKNSYSFGLMPGTNREKTEEELWSMKSASAEEMRLILSAYIIKDEDIFVIPYQQPYSSYMLTEETVRSPEYINNIRAMLGLDGSSPGPTGGTDTPTAAREDVAATTLSEEQTAIRQAILDHNRSKDPTGLVSCASFTELAVLSGTPLVGSNTHKITYYGWALYQEYKVKDNGLETISGSHIPVALSFDLDDRGYTLTEYWEPRDGSYYAQDIREKFPSHIVEDGMDSQKYVLQQTQECYAQAVAATGLNTDPVFATFIETICSSPAHSSNPADYIDAHYIEYRELLYYGRYTLQYCFSRFEQGGETGLEGHIMALACQEIAADWGEGFYPDHSISFTGQDWYDSFKRNALNLMGQYTEMELAERYPASCLLLSMLGEI